MDVFLAMLQDIDASLDAIDCSNFNAVVITGDFNAHFNPKDHQSSTKCGIDLALFLSCTNLFQLIEEPTRITATSETILDLVVTDSLFIVRVNLHLAHQQIVTIMLLLPNLIYLFTVIERTRRLSIILMW
jgi:hypothetical protein